MLEAEEYFYAIRLRANRVLQGRIAHLLKRPVGLPHNHVRRLYGDFEYQAASWDKPRRVVAKVEWHTGELLPRVGFVVTNLPMDPDWITRFYNLEVFLQGTNLPEEIADWSLTSLQTRLFKIGARVVRHARAITFQLAKLAVSGNLFTRTLAAIHRLRAPPVPA